MFKKPRCRSPSIIEKKVPAGAPCSSRPDTEGKFTLVDYPTDKYDSERMWVFRPRTW